MAYLGFSLPFTTRMTVVRLPDGGLWLHSPVPAAPELVTALESLGPVRHLIAPNSLHYSWIGEWHARFPDAIVHAVPGLARKAKAGLPEHRLLGTEPDPAWAGAIDQTLLAGPMLTEADFFHRQSLTLILTDLIENFEPRRVRSRAFQWLLRLVRVVDPDGSMPIDIRATFWRRRNALRSVVHEMIDWAPERIVVAHGRCYDRDGAAELRRAFAWLL